MKDGFGFAMFIGGLAFSYGGTFATFWYGVYLMVSDGFLTGLLTCTLGAMLVFIVGVIFAGIGKAVVEA